MFYYSESAASVRIIQGAGLVPETGEGGAEGEKRGEAGGTEGGTTERKGEEGEERRRYYQKGRC